MDQMEYVMHSPPQGHSQAQQPSACPYSQYRVDHSSNLPMVSPLRPTSHFEPSHPASNSWYPPSRHSYQWPPAPTLPPNPPTSHQRQSFPMIGRGPPIDSSPYNPVGVPPQAPNLPAYPMLSAQDPFTSVPSTHRHFSPYDNGHRSTPQSNSIPPHSGAPSQHHLNSFIGSFPTERSLPPASGQGHSNFLPAMPPPPFIHPSSAPLVDPSPAEPNHRTPVSGSGENPSLPGHPHMQFTFPIGQPSVEGSSHRRNPYPPRESATHGPLTSSRDSILEPRRRFQATSRTRRSQNRYSTQTDRDRWSDEDLSDSLLDHIHGIRGGMDESQLRATQFLRGSVTTKMVASPSALRSLQSVAVKDLPESERTCVICYNDFGVANPEGINEAPLRLPNCKHVFGDHCIKKWFEESDSCPYCRDKVPSEPRIQTTGRAFMHYMQTRNPSTPSSRVSQVPEDIYLRVLSASGNDSSAIVANSGRWQFERRSPPSDSGEPRRRIRPRTHATPRGSGSPPGGGSRPNSFGGSSSSPQHSPSRERGANGTSNYNLWSTTSGPRRSITPALNRTTFGQSTAPRTQVLDHQLRLSAPSPFMPVGRFGEVGDGGPPAPVPHPIPQAFQPHYAGHSVAPGFPNPIGGGISHASHENLHAGPSGQSESSLPVSARSQERMVAGQTAPSHSQSTSPSNIGHDGQPRVW